MKTKTFDIGTVLSVKTNRLLTAKHAKKGDNGIGMIYEILGWMTNDAPFTHQIPRFCEECAPWLLLWFPELNSEAMKSALEELDERLGSISFWSAEDVIKHWLYEIVTSGVVLENYDVMRIPDVEHQRIHPLDELEQMRPKSSSFVVKA